MQEQELNTIDILQKCLDELKEMSSEEVQRISKQKNIIIPPSPEELLTVDEWISVEDRYPGDALDKLLYSETIGIRRGYYNRYLKGFYYDQHENIDDVTHWREMPDRPNEQ